MSETRCTLCGGEMERGRAVVRKHIMAKMRTPWVSDRLAFIADVGDGRAETVIPEGRRFEAFRCRGCGALLITGQRWGIK